MKKLLLITSAILIIYGCQKPKEEEQLIDKWNGYESFYKAGEVYKDLIIGRHTKAGTVTYGIDDDANFYVTFQTNSSWKLEKTYLYAGTWANMPKSWQGNPKMQRFPSKTDHDPEVNTYTYRIPLTQLPPCAYPGFVVASYAELHSTYKCGTRENAWGGWDRRHADKTWGGYFIYYYNEPVVPHTLFYGVEVDAGGDLNLYLIQVNPDNTASSTLISQEAVGTDVTAAGTAYDAGNLFYALTSTETTLWVDNLSGTDLPYIAGTLNGTAVSADVYNSQYYYINTSNQIYTVSFTTDSDGIMTKNIETLYATVPATIDVNSIAINPTTGVLYVLGVSNANLQLISYNTTDQQFYTQNTAVNLANDALLSFAENGELYAVSSFSEGSLVSNLNPTTGAVLQTNDGTAGGGTGVGGGITKGLIQ